METDHGYLAAIPETPKGTGYEPSEALNERLLRLKEAVPNLAIQKLGVTRSASRNFVTHFIFEEPGQWWMIVSWPVGSVPISGPLTGRLRRTYLTGASSRMLEALREQATEILGKQWLWDIETKVSPLPKDSDDLAVRHLIILKVTEFPQSVPDPDTKPLVPLEVEAQFDFGFETEADDDD